MIQRIIGTIFVAIGGFFILVLIFGGGPVFPHVVGPAALAAVGALLLTLKRKTK